MTGAYLAATRDVRRAMTMLLVAFIFLTARIWFGDRAALIAGLLATLTGLFTFYEVLILQASIDAFTAAAVSGVSSEKRTSRRSVKAKARPASSASHLSHSHGTRLPPEAV